MEHFKYLMMIIIIGMIVAFGASMILLANLATIVTVAFGSGLLIGLFIGAYLYQLGSKLFSKKIDRSFKLR